MKKYGLFVFKCSILVSFVFLLGVISAGGVSSNTLPAAPIAVSISDNGNYIVAGSSLFTKTSNIPLWTADGVSLISISSDDNYVVGVGPEGLYLFSYADNTPLWIFGGSGGYIYFDSPVDSLAMSYDASYIAVGMSDGDLYLLTLDNVQLWEWHASSIFVRLESIAMSSTGDYIAVASTDGIYLFSRTENTPIWFYATDGWVDSIAMSSDGEYIAAQATISSGDDYFDAILFFSKTDNTPLWSYHVLYSYGEETISGVSMSSNGNYIVAGGTSLRLFSQTDNAPVWSYKASTTSVISKNAAYIAAVTESGLLLFNRNDNIPIWEWPVLDLGTVAISSDGSYIVVGSAPTVYLFSKENNMPLWSYPPILLFSLTTSGDSTVTAVTGAGVSGGGSVLFFGKDDNSLLWQWDYPGQDWLWPQVVLSADGKYAAVTTDTKVFLLDIENRQVVWSSYFGYQTFLHLGSWGQGGIAISSDGEQIMVATAYPVGTDNLYLFGDDDNIPLWRWEAPTPFTPPTYGQHAIYAATMSSNGSNIAVAAYEADYGRLFLFDNDDNVPLWSSIVGFIDALAFSADSEYVIAGGNHLWLFRIEDNVPLWGWDPPELTESIYDRVIEVAISDDGEYIAAATSSRLYFFHKGDNTPLWEYAPPKAIGYGYYGGVGGYAIYISSFSMSSDGKRIVLNSDNLRLFATEKDNVPVLEWEPPKVTIPEASTAFLGELTTDNLGFTGVISSDGKSISASTGVGLYLLDSDTGNPLWSYYSLGSPIVEEEPAEGPEKPTEWPASLIAVFIVATVVGLVFLLRWKVTRKKSID